MDFFQRLGNWFGGKGWINDEEKRRKEQQQAAPQPQPAPQPVRPQPSRQQQIVNQRIQAMRSNPIRAQRQRYRNEMSDVIQRANAELNMGINDTTGYYKQDADKLREELNKGDSANHAHVRGLLQSVQNRRKEIGEQRVEEQRMRQRIAANPNERRSQQQIDESINNWKDADILARSKGAFNPQEHREKLQLRDVRLGAADNNQTVGGIIDDIKGSSGIEQQKKYEALDSKIKDLREAFTDEEVQRRDLLIHARNEAEKHRRNDLGSIASGIAQGMTVDTLSGAGDGVAMAIHAADGSRERLVKSKQVTADYYNRELQKAIKNGDVQRRAYYSQELNRENREISRILGRQVEESDPIKNAGRIANAAALPFAFAAQASGVGVAAKAGITGVGVSRAATTTVGKLVQQYSPQLTGKLAQTTAGKVLNSTPAQIVGKVLPNASPRLQAVAAESMANVLSGVPQGVASTAAEAGSRGRLEDYLINSATGAVMDAAFPVAAYGAGRGVHYMGQGAKYLSGRVQALDANLRTQALQRSLVSDSMKPVNTKITNLATYEGAPDRVRVNEYKQAIQNGQDVSPLLIMRDESGKWGVEDGKHRLQAYRELGMKRVPVLPVDKEKLSRVLPEYEVQQLPVSARAEHPAAASTPYASAGSTGIAPADTTTYSPRGNIRPDAQFSDASDAATLHPAQTPYELDSPSTYTAGHADQDSAGISSYDTSVARNGDVAGSGVRYKHTRYKLAEMERNAARQMQFDRHNATLPLKDAEFNYGAVQRLAKGLEHGTAEDIAFIRMRPELLDEVNAIRANKGLAPLSTNEVVAYKNAINNHLRNRVNEGMSPTAVAHTAADSLINPTSRAYPGTTSREGFNRDHIQMVASENMVGDYDYNTSTIAKSPDGRISLKNITPRSAAEIKKAQALPGAPLAPHQPAGIGIPDGLGRKTEAQGVLRDNIAKTGENVNTRYKLSPEQAAEIRAYNDHIGLLRQQESKLLAQGLSESSAPVINNRKAQAEAIYARDHIGEMSPEGVRYRQQSPISRDILRTDALARHLKVTGDERLVFNEWRNEMEKNALGYYDPKTDKINLNQLTEDTLNHELGHKLLRRAENNAELIAHIRQEIGDDALIARYGKDYGTDDMNLLAEEYLADGFSDYSKGILNGEDKVRLATRLNIPQEIIAVYDRIIEAVKSLIGKQDQIRQFYAQMETGKFRNTPQVADGDMRVREMSLDASKALETIKKFDDVLRGIRRITKLDTISDDAAARITQATGIDVRGGASIELTNQNAIHIHNRHIKNPDDPRPLGDYDIAALPEVIKDPDTITVEKVVRGAQRIKFEREMEGNKKAVVEVIKKGNALNVVTYFNDSSSGRPNAAEATSGYTLETGQLQSTNPDDIVANPPRIVNDKRFKVGDTSVRTNELEVLEGWRISGNDKWFVKGKDDYFRLPRWANDELYAMSQGERSRPSMKLFNLFKKNGVTFEFDNGKATGRLLKLPPEAPAETATARPTANKLDNAARQEASEQAAGVNAEGSSQSEESAPRNLPLPEGAIKTKGNLYEQTKLSIRDDWSKPWTDGPYEYRQHTKRDKQGNSFTQFERRFIGEDGTHGDWQPYSRALYSWHTQSGKIDKANKQALIQEALRLAKEDGEVREYVASQKLGSDGVTVRELTGDYSIDGGLVRNAKTGEVMGNYIQVTPFGVVNQVAGKVNVDNRSYGGAHLTRFLREK